MAPGGKEFPKTTRAVHKCNVRMIICGVCWPVSATAATFLTISRFAAGILPARDHSAFATRGIVLSVPAAMRAVPILRAISPKRLMSRLSVRSRIIAITLIPVVGFLAIAAAYIAGVRSVERAVEEVRQATEL